MKDKVFFFGAYEGQIYDVGNSFGGVTSPSMVAMPTDGSCVFLSTGDCTDSIPDVIADSAGGEVIPISPASLTICRLHAVRGQRDLQRKRVSAEQQSQHQHSERIPQRRDGL